MRVLFLALLFPHAARACTVLAAGRKATADGSVMVTHSDDGEGDSDPRVAFIPAANHSAGAMRDIWPDIENYPRFVGDNPARGIDGVFTPKAGQEETLPIGRIPQVAHTYAYYDSNFAMQNERQVSIGETTCSAIFGSVARGQPDGTALMSINELSRIALERAASAREAIETMGSLASEHGFYGPGTFEGTGETLAVADPKEAFIFHILPDPTGYSALWVAQRVPDENVTVVANMFTVREVDCDDAHNFYCSPNLLSVARERHLWDGQGQLDFTRTYSDGEYAHHYYSGRRMWGALRLMKPSLKLNPRYNDLKNDTNPHPQPGWTSHFPWSVTPDAPVTAQSFMNVHRDHYEGTEFDTTQGLAAGPFGTPERYATLGTPGDKASGSKGAWERTIGLYRTTFSWVIQARGWLPDAVGGTTWFGTADADKTVFVPLYVASGGVPPSLMLGHQLELDRAALYWAHRYVQNLVQLRYAPMMEDVRKLQAALEHAGHALQYNLDERFGGATDAELREGGARAAEFATAVRQQSFAHADRVLKNWWQLADMLMVKYADGYLTTADSIGVPMGYPAWFLNATGFHDGPKRIDSDHP